MLIGIPIITDRDFLLYGFGVNLIKEENAMIILVRSIDDEDVFKDVYYQDKKCVRGIIKIFGWRIQIINRNKVLIKGLVHADVKINFIPQSWINTFSKEVRY